MQGSTREARRVAAARPISVTNNSTWVHVGQAGNQLSPQIDEYLDRKGTVLHVDSEAKVVEGLGEQRSVLFEQSGRGSNWAYGYNSHWKRENEDDIENAHHVWDGEDVNMGIGGMGGDEQDNSLAARVRRRLDGDSKRQLVLVHSAGGGTGAGLGSRLLEELAYQYKSVVGCTILSSISSETCLQSYSTVFTLSYLQEFADGCLLFDNSE